MNRYTNKRHRGPNDRGFWPTIAIMEGNIPVVVATNIKHLSNGYYHEHIRGFFLHPTKGWRSTGPEGLRK